MGVRAQDRNIWVGEDSGVSEEQAEEEERLLGGMGEIWSAGHDRDCSSAVSMAFKQE